MSIKITKGRITAAEDDFDTDFDTDFVDDPDDTVGDHLDDIQDDIEDIQDDIEDIKEDDEQIEIDNNIVDHYIAECDKCKGIFISAVIRTEQEIDHITGKCPLCEKESDQYLKWYVAEV